MSLCDKSYLDSFICVQKKGELLNFTCFYYTIGVLTIVAITIMIKYVDYPHPESRAGSKNKRSRIYFSESYSV